MTHQIHDAADQAKAVASAAAQAAPSVSLLWAWVADIPISAWVGLTSIAFIALQAAYLVWKWRRELRGIK
jgi:hypothetical protein